MSAPVKAVVAHVADLPPGAAKQVTVNGMEIALFNVGGKLCAIADTCPHRGGPLSDGALAGTTLSCPWHAWDFDVTTGACITNPAASVKTYPVEVQGSDVLVTV